MLSRIVFLLLGLRTFSWVGEKSIRPLASLKKREVVKDWPKMAKENGNLMQFVETLEAFHHCCQLGRVTGVRFWLGGPYLPWARSNSLCQGCAQSKAQDWGVCAAWKPKVETGLDVLPKESNPLPYTHPKTEREREREKETATRVFLGYDMYWYVCVFVHCSNIHINIYIYISYLLVYTFLLRTSMVYLGFEVAWVDIRGGDWTNLWSSVKL